MKEKFRLENFINNSIFQTNMTERFINEAEQEAREVALDLFKTLAILWTEQEPRADLWTSLLRKIRTRYENFRYRPTIYGEFLFVPQVYEKDKDEHLIFKQQGKSAYSHPEVEWRALHRNTPETMELFTTILSLQNGQPKIYLMQESHSIFVAKDKRIDELLLKCVPKMETKTLTIEESGDPYFSREELGKKVEGEYFPFEEVLPRIQIPT